MYVPHNKLNYFWCFGANRTFKNRTFKSPQGFPLERQVLDKMLLFAESYLFIIFPNKLSLFFLSEVILEDETSMVIQTYFLPYDTGTEL
jgi:hypothetical protein